MRLWQDICCVENDKIYLYYEQKYRRHKEDGGHGRRDHR